MVINDEGRQKGISDMILTALGAKGLQDIVEFQDGQYNVLDTEGFDWAPEMTNTFSCYQLTVTDSVATMPDLIDKASRGTSIGGRGFEGKRMDIPRFGRNFALDEELIRSKFALYEELGYSMTGRLRDSILEEMYTSVGKLMRGYNNVLTHMRDQIVSTGHMNFGNGFFPTSNLQHLNYDFGFTEMPANTGEKRWWTTDEHIPSKEGKQSDPLKDFQQIVRENGNGRGWHFEINLSLWNDLKTHTKVLGMIGTVAYPTNAGSGDKMIDLGRAISVDEDTYRMWFERLIGARVVTRDTMTSYETVDTETRKPKTVTKDNFSLTNIAFRPDGRLGAIQASRPMLMSSVNSNLVAYAMDGRLQFLNTVDERSRTQIIDAELTAMVVPERADQMGYQTVTA